MNETLAQAFQLWLTFCVVYFWGGNLVCFGLLLSSFFSVRNTLRLQPLVETLKNPSTVFAPPISLITPAYNAESTIVDSLKSFLALKYPQYEVVVLNDASKDNTFSLLKETFQLESTPMVYDDRLSTSPVLGTYRSKIYPNLVVIDKATNTGKAESQNVGIGYAQYDLVCIVDSDSVLEEDALAKVALPFIQNPDKVLGCGGVIRVLNGCTVDHGRVKEVRLPRNFLGLMQVVEYLRAFLYGRVGWNVPNTTVIISGAFGLFNKKALIAVGGYTKGSMGEDAELVVRLHRYFLRNRSRYKIVFLPDPICWTEVPSTFKTLGRQRDRWQRGLAETLFAHKSMLFNPKYGFMGFVTLPYYYLIELWGPVIEMLAYLSLPIAYYFGILNREALILFVMVTVIYGVLVSTMAVLIEEFAFAKYSRVRDLFALMGVAALENVGYRQLNCVWRITGLLNFFRGKKSW